MDCLGLSVVIFTGLISLVYFYGKWKHSYWRRKLVPQLHPEFLYGNAKDMIQDKKSLGETFLDIYKNLRKTDVDYGGAYLGYKAVFMPVTPELIKTIMQKDFEHFTAHFSEIGQGLIWKGLFHLSGDPWRQSRRNLTPTFTSGKMKTMFKTLLEKTIGLGTITEEYAVSGEPVNIKDILARFTSDVIGSVGFGIDCNAIKDPESEFVRNGKKILELPKHKSGIFGFILRLIETRRRRDTKSVDDFFRNMVKQTIEHREKNNIYRKDFMHLMIQLKNRGAISDDEQIFNKSQKSGSYDLDEITAQCLIFFIAGYETSATTMSFAIYELARNQEIQAKVRKEANDILKSCNGKLTYEAMMKLTYTQQVIEETLRKYPPLGAIPRSCTKNYTIPGTKIVIEKGTMVQIPAWGLHMDPEYFSEPEKFDPDRFSPENKPKIKDFTYIPFGEGPRMCLGLRFGMMQTKAGLISLIKDYNFTLNKRTPAPIQLQKDTVITSAAGGIWVDITKISSSQ